jgi:hypothetical protein
MADVVAEVGVTERDIESLADAFGYAEEDTVEVEVGDRYEGVDYIRFFTLA